MAVFGHKRGSLIAKEQRLPCALFVVKKLRMKSIFSGGAQGGRCFVVRSKPQTTLDRSVAAVHLEMWYLSWKTLSQSLGRIWDQVHEHTSISCNTLPDSVLSDERFGRETWSNESVVAWLDGACVCNQDARFRRAGCGVFFGVDRDRNCSFTLPGREQTNNRAELLAVITAMQVHDGNLEIRSDSE